VANPEEASGDSQALARRFDGPRFCALENPRLPAAIFAIVNDCLLKARKARANRLQAGRLRRMTPEGNETAVKSGCGLSRPPTATRGCTATIRESVVALATK
jgi:hypothetical protein